MSRRRSTKHNPLLVVHEVSLTLENLFLGEFLMLKSTGLVHLATIYIDAVSVFKSWSHWKSET